MLKNNSSKNGFVLIEAIAAIVVVSVCLTLITQTLLTNFRTAVRFQQGVRTLLALENRIGLLYATNGTVDQFIPMPQTLEAPYGAFSIQSQTRKLDEHLKQVQLTLSWSTEKGTNTLSAPAIIYNPNDVKIRSYIAS